MEFSLIDFEQCVLLCLGSFNITEVLYKSQTENVGAAAENRTATDSSRIRRGNNLELNLGMCVVCVCVCVCVQGEAGETRCVHPCPG